MYLNQSLGMKVIARLLNERKIVSPDSHRMLLKGMNVDEDKLYCWCGNTVTKIIRRREYVGDTTGKTVYDLYSGTGTIAQLVAPVAEKVYGVEIVEDAIKDAIKKAVDVLNIVKIPNAKEKLSKRLKPTEGF